MYCILYKNMVQIIYCLNEIFLGVDIVFGCILNGSKLLRRYNMIVMQALENLIMKAQEEHDDMALVVLNSLKEYVENGGKLSNLTWFNGLNLERIEFLDRLKVA